MSIATTPAKLKSSLRRSGTSGALFDVHCCAGRHDRPYPETHSTFTIALVRRGTFEYRAADTNRKHGLRPGWLIVGQQGATFECSHVHDGGDECTVLSFDSAVVDDVASSIRGCRGAAFPHPVWGPLVRVSALVDRLATGIADVDETIYDVAAAVVESMHDRWPTAVVEPVATRARVDTAMAYIEERFAAPIPLVDIAAAAGLSPFHFLRAFKRITGTTPHQYVIGARLRHAARLLVDTSRSVTEIAFEVGFEDVSNFVRTFHRIIGRSPRQFRRSQ